MSWGQRSRVTRGALLVSQGALLATGIVACLMGDQLGGAIWVIALVSLGGILAPLFWTTRRGSEEEAGEVLLLTEEAIRREAKRLDSRRAEIGKLLMAYGEWMEFPDFEELHKAEWATVERSAQDAEVAALLDKESNHVLRRVSEGHYWVEGQLQTRVLLSDLGDFVESIAQIYNPESARPVLETNLEELLKAVNRVSLQVILLLEEVPLLDVKEWNLRQVADKVRGASKVVRKYEDLQPILSPVRYLWQGSKFLLASNPILAAGWIAGSNLVREGAKKIGKRSLDAYLMSVVRQVLGIVAWETASIYDHTNRFRNPEWVYGVELVHLMSECPLERDTLKAAFAELGPLALRSSYDRIFLYRCVAQHVSPRPERFIQTDLMTEETRREIATALDKFSRKHLGDYTGKKQVKWRRGLSQRLALEMPELEDLQEG